MLFLLWKIAVIYIAVYSLVRNNSLCINQTPVVIVYQIRSACETFGVICNFLLNNYKHMLRNEANLPIAKTYSIA